jgi:hypothetical protein
VLSAQRPLFVVAFAIGGRCVHECTIPLIIVELRIADTFTDSLARLTGEEQKAVKTTTVDNAFKAK